MTASEPLHDDGDVVLKSDSSVTSHGAMYIELGGCADESRRAAKGVSITSTMLRDVGPDFELRDA